LHDLFLQAYFRQAIVVKAIIVFTTSLLDAAMLFYRLHYCRANWRWAAQCSIGCITVEAVITLNIDPLTIPKYNDIPDDL